MGPSVEGKLRPCRNVIPWQFHRNDVSARFRFTKTWPHFIRASGLPLLVGVSCAVLLGNHGVACQVHDDGIDPRFWALAAHRMELNAKLLWVRGDAQVTVIDVVKIVECEPSAKAGKIRIEIVHWSAGHRIRRRYPSPSLDKAPHVVAPIAGDDEWHGVVLPGEADVAGVTLIVVGVTGKECVRVYPLRLADGIDLRQHRCGTAVGAACTAGLRWRRITERRMMNRN